MLLLPSSGLPSINALTPPEWAGIQEMLKDSSWTQEGLAGLATKNKDEQANDNGHDMSEPYRTNRIKQSSESSGWYNYYFGLKAEKPRGSRYECGGNLRIKHCGLSWVAAVATAACQIPHWPNSRLVGGCWPVRFHASACVELYCSQGGAEPTLWDTVLGWLVKGRWMIHVYFDSQQFWLGTMLNVYLFSFRKHCDKGISLQVCIIYIYIYICI